MQILAKIFSPLIKLFLPAFLDWFYEKFKQEKKVGDAIQETEKQSRDGAAEVKKQTEQAVTIVERINAAKNLARRFFGRR
jgi:hypothetical protein